MKTKVHATAGLIAFLTILTFWTSTAYVELFASYEAVAAVKTMILQGMVVLIPAMAIAGASGMFLGGKRRDELAAAKKKRMPVIAGNGLLILLPSAFFLESKAASGAFDEAFYMVQILELCAGAVNLTLLGLNIRDGLTMTGRLGSSAKLEQVAPDTATIEGRDGGPLAAKNVSRLTNVGGKELETSQVMALCRCGASSNKPYCDGSHNEIGFDTNTANSGRTADKVRVFEGNDIQIHYNRLLCSHAGVCGSRLKSVFDPSRTPWIKPDNGSNDEIISVIRSCPSGALSFSLEGQEPQHEIEASPGITVEKNGPFQITQAKLLNTKFGRVACPDKYVLCRCGCSRNMPFCDGTHHDIEWQDEQQE